MKKIRLAAVLMCGVLGAGLAAALMGGIVWAAGAPLQPTAPPDVQPAAPAPAPAKAAVTPHVKTGLPDKAISQGIGFNGLPSRTIPESMGFNVHLKGPDSEWDAIKASGLKFIRKDFFWSDIERSKGNYDFSEYDKMLAALEARGIRALFILAYRNELYPKPEDSDEGRAAYAKWAAASAAHYKGRNVLWELWNEPNNEGFWQGPGGKNSAAFAEQYLTLVKKTVPAMRAADPNCSIIGGSVAGLDRGAFNWIDAALKAGLLKTGINGLSVHPYGYPRPELTMEGGKPGEEGYDLLREKMTQAGAPKDFPILNTELGYWAKGAPAQERRATFFVRTCLVEQMCDIRLTIWYNWDGGGEHGVSGGGPEGLPMLRACKIMTAELAGYHFVERLKVGTQQDYVAAFENAAKGRKIAAWTTPPGRDDQAQAQAHDVSLPTGGATSVVVHDLYGKEVAAKVEGGKVTVNLTGSPLYISLGKGAAK
jgi:hypothetical protein